MKGEEKKYMIHKNHGKPLQVNKYRQKKIKQREKKNYTSTEVANRYKDYCIYDLLYRKKKKILICNKDK